MGFRVGDRVRITNPYCDTGWKTTGTVADEDGPARQWGVRPDDGPFKGEVGYFSPSHLEPLVSLMVPYTPRDGDEITMSMRGDVSADAGGWVLHGERELWVADFEHYEVEVHKRGPEPKPKLPTTPGSVIRRASYVFARSATGWRRVDINSHTLIDDESMKSASAYETLYDAGAS